MSKGITRDRLVAAALDVLDEGGIEAVTVRAVAKRLEVQAPALYWHVRSKQELLDEMGTEVQRRVQEAIAGAVPGENWRADLEAYARALRAEYLAHRDGARTFSGTRLTDAGLLRDQEPWLQRWTADGLELGNAVDAAQTVTAFVVGFTIEEQERVQSMSSDPERYDLESRDAGIGLDAPLARAVGHLRGDANTQFERQLEIVLTGLTATFASAEAQARHA